MLISTALIPTPIGNDCKDQFKSAYENRYTWPLDFTGYMGKCVYTNIDETVESKFTISKHLEVNLDISNDPKSKDKISSQLFDVTIHRIKRPFDEVHGRKSFEYSDINSIGRRININGSKSGDFYRIKENVITMVYRHIHGRVIQVITDEILTTPTGYLSSKYSSQSSSDDFKSTTYIADTFVPLIKSNIMVLEKRLVQKHFPDTGKILNESFNFIDLVDM